MLLITYTVNVKFQMSNFKMSNVKMSDLMSNFKVKRQNKFLATKIDIAELVLINTETLSMETMLLKCA